jgi:hypothetical protein
VSDKYKIKQLEWEAEFPVVCHEAKGIAGKYSISSFGSGWTVFIEPDDETVDEVGAASTLNEAKAIAEKDNDERLLPYLEAVA